MKKAEIIVIYVLIIYLSITAYQIYSRTTDIYSIPLLLLALLIGLILGTIVNLIYFKSKKRDKKISSWDKGIQIGSISTSGSYQTTGSLRKEFIDATIYQSRYITSYALFIIISIIFLYWVPQALYNYFNFYRHNRDEGFYSFIWIIASVSFLVLVALVFLRKYWIFKIITDEKGMTFIGLLKKRQVLWSEITSLGTTNNILGNFTNWKVAKVKTRDSDYIFPFTMKEKEQTYPMFSGPKFKGLTGMYIWKDREGNEKEINLENCPLYNEIQRHLNK